MLSWHIKVWKSPMTEVYERYRNSSYANFPIIKKKKLWVAGDVFKSVTVFQAIYFIYKLEMSLNYQSVSIFANLYLDMLFFLPN